MDHRLARGFSLIQLVIVLLIMAILTAVVAPRVTMFTPSPCDEFATNCTSLLRLAYARALTTSKLHRILFRTQERTMVLEEEGGTTSTGEKKFVPATGLTVPTRYIWGGSVKIRNFFIKRIDENAGGTLKDAWLYVFPLGLTQEIMINIEDTERRTPRGLVINPFSSQCAVYDTFQNP